LYRFDGAPLARLPLLILLLGRRVAVHGAERELEAQLTLIVGLERGLQPLPVRSLQQVPMRLGDHELQPLSVPTHELAVLREHARHSTQLQAGDELTPGRRLRTVLQQQISRRGGGSGLERRCRFGASAPNGCARTYLVRLASSRGPWHPVGGEREHAQ